MAKGFDAFVTWLNDWRGSTARIELSLAGRAAYRELMEWQFTYGSKGASGLPNDNATLARMVGVSLEEWLSVRDEVLVFFETNDDGLLENIKVTEQIAYVREKTESGRKGGKKSKRTLSKQPSETQANGQANSQAKRKPSSSSSSSSGEDLDVLKKEHPQSDTDWIQLIDRWNLMARKHGRPQIQKLTKTRKEKLNARLKEYPDFFDLVEAELGRLNTFAREGSWLNFDFILAPSKLAKLLEGIYRSNDGKASPDSEATREAHETEERRRTALIADIERYIDAKLIDGTTIDQGGIYIPNEGMVPWNDVKTSHLEDIHHELERPSENRSEGQAT